MVNNYIVVKATGSSRTGNQRRQRKEKLNCKAEQSCPSRSILYLPLLHNLQEHCKGHNVFSKHFGHKTTCMCYQVKHVGLHGGSWGDALTYTSHGRRMKEDDIRHTKLIWKILCHQKSFPINVERHPLMLLPCKKLRN